MKHSELTSKIIGICIKVHDKLGPGLLESVYEEVICYELKKHNLGFKRQKGIPVVYDSIRLDLGFRADIIVENEVILEIKSIENIAPVHSKIVMTYLKLTGLEVGLLINFNITYLKDGITRLVMDNNKKG
jgi:GxxExxY protein